MNSEQTNNEENPNQKPKPHPAYLNRRAQADRLGLSVSTIDRWVKKQIIPAIKHGQTVIFCPEDVDAALRHQGGQGHE